MKQFDICKNCDSASIVGCCDECAAIVKEKGWKFKYRNWTIFGNYLYHDEVFIRTPDDELLPNMFFNIQQAHNWIDAHIEAERNHNGNQ